MGKNRLTQATKHHHSWVTTGDRMLKVVSAFATDQSCVGYRGTKLWDLKSNKPNLSEKYGFVGATFPGWWYTYPSEKYESQLGLFFPIYQGTIQVPLKPVPPVWGQP
jgi:hypothetical protein